MKRTPISHAAQAWLVRQNDRKRTGFNRRASPQTARSETLADSLQAVERLTARHVSQISRTISVPQSLPLLQLVLPNAFAASLGDFGGRIYSHSMPQRIEISAWADCGLPFSRHLRQQTASIASVAKYISLRYGTRCRLPMFHVPSYPSWRAIGHEWSARWLSAG